MTLKGEMEEMLENAPDHIIHHFACNCTERHMQKAAHLLTRRVRRLASKALASKRLWVEKKISTEKMVQIGINAQETLGGYGSRWVIKMLRAEYRDNQDEITWQYKTLKNYVDTYHSLQKRLLWLLKNRPERNTEPWIADLEDAIF